MVHNHSDNGLPKLYWKKLRLLHESCHIILFVAKGQEAHARPGSGHNVGCYPNVLHTDDMPVDGHCQRSLRAVRRLQQCRYGESDSLGRVLRGIPSAAGVDDFLLFSHCLHVAYQGKKTSSCSRSEF